MGRNAAYAPRENQLILFLDYDGVLHPDPCPDAARLFENAERLARVLEEFPEVGIVLSTSWRNVRSETELLEPLPEILRHRVLGVTPNFSEFSAAAARIPYQRHAECEQWLQMHEMASSPWWALDDRPSWFAPYCENLIECDANRGFDDRVSACLSSALAVARKRYASGVDFILT